MGMKEGGTERSLVEKDSVRGERRYSVMSIAIAMATDMDYCSRE